MRGEARETRASKKLNRPNASGIRCRATASVTAKLRARVVTRSNINHSALNRIVALVGMQRLGRSRRTTEIIHSCHALGIHLLS